MDLIPTLIAIIGGIIAFFFILGTAKSILNLRRIAKANEVHIVQSNKKRISYGADQKENGNTYYAWPSWIPFIGVTTSVLPLNVFQLDVEDYVGMDSGRIGFYADIRAFFRIKEPNKAAERISSVEDCKKQLTAIIEGAARAVFAGKDIEEILSGRKDIGAAFTDEVDDKLASEYGIVVIGHIELMDIRDLDEENGVIHNLMMKKQSFINMESRKEVAKNTQAAEIAEIDAQREIDLQKQEALQKVGLRKVESDRAVEISEQEKNQDIADKVKVTTEKQLAITEIEKVRNADIEKQTKVIKAQEQKEVAELKAEADLSIETKNSEGVKIAGAAKAEAEKALLLAPIEAQIQLAKEIGANKEYQEYLIKLEEIKAGQVVGIEQAKALVKADIKIISSGNGGASIGTQFGAALEGFANTPTGKAVMNTLGIQQEETKAKDVTV